MPQLELVNLEIAGQGRSRPGLAAAQAERDRGVVRASWSGVVTDVPAEIGQAAFVVRARRSRQIVALDPMLAVVEVAERKLAGIKVGDMAEVRLVTGEHRQRARSALSRSPRARPRAPIEVEIEVPNPDRHHPRRHHGRSRHPAVADAGDPRAALGADLLVGRRPRRPRRQR